MSEEKVPLEVALAKKRIEHDEAYIRNAKAIIASYEGLPPSVKVEFELPPNLDIRVLEHDPAWTSFKKYGEGRCTFPAEEGKSAWVRIKNVSDDSPILRLVKAMGRNKMEKVSLGLFQYTIRGDFLQRRPLKKP